MKILRATANNITEIMPMTSCQPTADKSPWKQFCHPDTRV